MRNRKMAGASRIFYAPFHQGGAWRYRVAPVGPDGKACGAKTTCTFQVAACDPPPKGTIPRDAMKKEVVQALHELAALDQAESLDPSLKPVTPMRLCAALRKYLTEHRASIKQRKPTWAAWCSHANMTMQLLADAPQVVMAGDPSKLPESPVLVRDITYGMLKSRFIAWYPNRIPQTRIQFLRFLRAAFRSFRKENWTKTNPAEEYLEEVVRAWNEEKKGTPRPDKRMKTEQIQALLKAARDPYTYTFAREKFRPFSKEKEMRPPAYLEPAIRILLRSGLRKSNLFGNHAMRWTDLKNLDDDSKATLAIGRDRMKVDTTDFEVPLHPEVVHILRGWKTRTVLRPTARVFGNASLDRFSEAFEDAAARAGLEDVTCHWTRHSFESEIREIAPEAICRKLTHRTAEGSAATYEHISVDAARGVLNLLPWVVPQVASKIGEIQVAGIQFS